ncbi:hypothetical protein [Streptomyces sp. NPDC001975]
MTHTSGRRLLTGAAGLGGPALATTAAAAAPAGAVSGPGAGRLNVRDTDSAHRDGRRLHGLTLDGRDQKDATGAAADGVRSDPDVKDVGMDEVTVPRRTGHGLDAQSTSDCRLHQVHRVDNDGHGHGLTEPAQVLTGGRMAAGSGR